MHEVNVIPRQGGNFTKPHACIDCSHDHVGTSVSWIKTGRGFMYQRFDFIKTEILNTPRFRAVIRQFDADGKILFDDFVIQGGFDAAPHVDVNFRHHLLTVISSIVVQKGLVLLPGHVR